MSLTDECVKKARGVHTVQHYSAARKNETMPYAAPWRDLEIVIMNDISQTEKQRHLCTSLIVESRKS